MAGQWQTRQALRSHTARAIGGRRAAGEWPAASHPALGTGFTGCRHGLGLSLSIQRVCYGTPCNFGLCHREARNASFLDKLASVAILELSMTSMLYYPRYRGLLHS